LLIAVTGDTHGRIQSIIKELKKKKPDYLLYTGDYYTDGIKIAQHLKIEFAGVKGNCDVGRKGDKEKNVKLCGYRFYLVHGHQHGVKNSINNIYYRGKEVGADVVLFGHTHVPFCEFYDGMWIINPGSPTLPRSESAGSYALIQLEEDSLLPEIIKI